jgi:hypothetical protein
MRVATAFASFSIAALLLSACGTSYADRVAYLREVGLRGIETHNLLSAQNTQVTRESCENANTALNDDLPVLSENPTDVEKQAFSKLVEETFIKACVLGQY